MPDDEHEEHEPEVFAVEIDADRIRLSRRDFVELAAASAAAALVVTGCTNSKSTPTPTTSPSSPSPTPPGGGQHGHVQPSPSPTPTKPPGKLGKVQPGHKGAEYRLNGKTYVLQCGQPIPHGAVCTCNCVSVPLPGSPGTVQPGHKGAEYHYGGKSYVLQCGEPIPSGAVCTCNCVTVPPSCSCVGYTPCACDSDTGCSAVSHYWYPN